MIDILNVQNANGSAFAQIIASNLTHLTPQLK